MGADFVRISYTLLGDGSRDFSIFQQVLGWIVRQTGPNSLQVRPQIADFREMRDPPTSLSERLREAVRRYPCDILFVHRDAEGQLRECRVSEIDDAQKRASLCNLSVPVVPVRMTEAWLLGSESALRLAADNPNGKARLSMPRIRDLEAIPDPKRLLHDLLITASEKPGRRGKMFIRDMNQHVRRVAEYTEDYSHLGCLPAFQAVVEDTAEAISTVLKLMKHGG